MIVKIAKAGNNETLTFAAEELKRILSAMDPSAEIFLLSYRKYDPSVTDAIWVTDEGDFPVPEVANPTLDDGISIKVQHSVGYITGTNKRSVLIAVYRFLRELGCAFIRTGKGGEVIPKRAIDNMNVDVFEAASYRHRAVCIEGAISQQNVLDMIDWLPKMGMNSYLNQFHNQYFFYERWYGHRNNPTLPVQGMCTEKDGEGITLESISQIKKRGMLYHAEGHGWTHHPFGLDGIKEDKDIPENKRELLALINGKRTVFNKAMGNTNLCYSNEYVRNTIAEAVADCCAETPEMDYVHFWLADYGNNHCECENCKKHIPSDFYVMMLNRIDELLTERGLNTKVIFLVYVDLLWAPVEFTLNNPDRFVMMFAPISRTYSTALAKAEKFPKEKLKPYERNNLFISPSVGWNIAMLNKWQERFPTCDSFDYDYHFMWDHHKDPGYYKMAEVLFDDMKNLDKIGLNGMVSCQNQRTFFPTGLGMTAMAEALWNKTADFEDVSTKYFLDSFGKDGKAVKEYMKLLSELFDPSYLRGEKTVVSKEQKANFDRIPSVIDEFADLVKRNAENEALEAPRRKSWQYLTYHGELCKLTAKTFAYYAAGDFDKGEAMKQTAKAYAQLNETALQEVYDVCYFIVTIENITKGLIAAANNQKTDVQFE